MESKQTNRHKLILERNSFEKYSMKNLCPKWVRECYEQVADKKISTPGLFTNMKFLSLLA
jgi:hypothetical protein